MKITSHGAAQEVTGSKHLVEHNGYRILLDCGLFQGKRNDSDRKNRHFGFDPETLHQVILSHAHIDHSGLLPLLAKRGYRGTVYATPATRDLCAIMLQDSAHIQQRDAEWLSKKNMSFVAPLYEAEDAREIMRRFVCVPYEVRVPLGNGVFLTFHDAGHVLGSAMVELEFEEEQGTRRLIYSGDIGRNDMPILEDPWRPEEADVVIMESTYGDRDHGPIKEIDGRLAKLVNETVERGGKMVIPSFALERAQEVIYSLKRLESAKAIPELPIFVDSPLTVNITEVFRLHTEAFDDDFAALMQDAGDPFQLAKIRYIRNRDESIALNNHEGPAIIVSASGMCEFGRIVHHLRNTIEDPKNTVLIVGFQAEHTLGRRIVEKRRQVKIFGVKRDLRAQVAVMNEFSAHAGKSELVEFGSRFANNGTTVLLAHGEVEAVAELKSAIEQRGVQSVLVQEQGKTFEI